jgi:hypothetical protein
MGEEVGGEVGPPFSKPFRNQRKAAYEKAHSTLVSTAICPIKPLCSNNQ